MQLANCTTFRWKGREFFLFRGLHAAVHTGGRGSPYHITKERTAQAMRKTNYLGLNLWDLEDRIKMEDFNSDHELLDQALRKASRGAKHFLNIIDDTGTNIGCGQIYWGPDAFARWEDYSLVLIYGNLRPVNSGDSVYFHIIPDRFNADLNTPEVEIIYPSGGFFVLLTPLHDEERMIQGLIGSSGTLKGFQGKTPFRDFTTLKYGGIKAGTTRGSANFYADFIHLVGIY